MLMIERNVFRGVIMGQGIRPLGSSGRSQSRRSRSKGVGSCIAPSHRRDLLQSPGQEPPGTREKLSAQIRDCCLGQSDLEERNPE